MFPLLLFSWLGTDLDRWSGLNLCKSRADFKVRSNCSGPYLVSSSMSWRIQPSGQPVWHISWWRIPYLPTSTISSSCHCSVPFTVHFKVNHKSLLCRYCLLCHFPPSGTTTSWLCIVHIQRVNCNRTEVKPVFQETSPLLPLNSRNMPFLQT